MASKEEIRAQSAKLAEKANADVLLCNAAIERDLDAQIISLCHRRKRRPNLILILVTEGGSPDVAFRISRTLQTLYERFYCMISGYCKSAGTLLSLGAHEIIFGHHGELGPLDIQMAKKDELLESESGLTVMTALTALHEKALLAFEHFFLQTTMRGGGRISVRTASTIATELTRALFSPISDQIDPLHVGEAWRSMTIAKAYGERLMEKSKNFTLDTLETLISEYPSHGFVIDRLEADNIFNNVRAANAEEQAFLDLHGAVMVNPLKSAVVRYLTEEISEVDDNVSGDTETTLGQQHINVEPVAQAGGHVPTNGHPARAAES